ncbi:ABC transporter permease [Gordonia defluvii]|uniref:Transport permease protein n=1 Tax=Gordonia defluvii TaxID=283718 RepID=A0ABP6KU19_9ACTN|nr:ABC transporter permease [Gordonia sp. UBA5067]
MNPKLLGATTIRVLRQVRADHRSLAMVLLLPLLLLTLLYFMFVNVPVPPGHATPFDRFGIIMLGILPFTVMFVITSVAMLRERRAGTLERLMTTPLSRLGLLGGYAVAFGLLAVAQTAITCSFTFWALHLHTVGSRGWIAVIALSVALLGVALGLLCSAFAQTEFQAVQFLPLVVIPQLFLCGLFVARAELPGWMQALANVMPLSYAVEALQQVATEASVTSTMIRDLLVVVAIMLVSLALAAATLRRRTP